MCGRTCCNLPINIYTKASCQYNKEKEKYQELGWMDLTNNGMEFQPTINCAPQSITPVLVAKDHFNTQADSNMIVPMLWGMIPLWHEGDFKSHGLSTNNCRIESMTSSKLYAPSFNQGRRCVVVCEGFYEWQTTKKNVYKKQPYFIYAKQKKELVTEDIDSWTSAQFSTDKGWDGPKLLAMAALFNKWCSCDGYFIYSYSIITMEANPHFSWLHHRMPAFLTSDYEINEWLNFSKVSSGQAYNLLKPSNNLSWHPVSHTVGNSKNKSNECNKKIDLSKTMESASSSLMKAWLSKSKTVSASDEGGPVKKPKLA